MKIEIKHIMEFHSLYGGNEKIRAIGHPFQALVHHHFRACGSLIFSIIEHVNLNNTSADGLGDTLFFTHEVGDSENQHIKEEYKRIIDLVEKRFEHTLAEYIEWYGTDTVLITVETGSTRSFDTKNSWWRPRFFANREGKGKKDKFGFIKFEENGVKTFLQFVEEYFQYYIELLSTELGFKEFPYFVVIAKPISAKNRNGIVKLGNLYLHFATTELKSDEFYHRLINDFLLIWLQEESTGIVNQIGSQAVRLAKKEATIFHNTHLPTIWASKNNAQFEQSEIDKLYSILGTSEKTIRDFYYEIFVSNSMGCHSKLEEKENKIVKELVPVLLKNRSWLREDIKVVKINTLIQSIKADVEHRRFKGFTEKYVEKFTALLAMRHVVNVCFCCFGYEISEIHRLLSAGDIGDIRTKSGNTMEGYFTKLFFYSSTKPQKNITRFNQQDAFISASFKEREFLKVCANKISQLISPAKQDDYNKKAVENLRLSAPEMKKFDTGTVSRLLVFDFKKNWCDENEIIADLLKNRAGKYLVAPILDCGAGLGDIAYKAFYDKEAILIDVNNIEDKETPTSSLHKNVIKSFFDYYPEKPIRTLLISHTLQFIDSDINQLNEHIQILSPDTIIHVSNLNDDIMGNILKWTKENYPNANPEERIQGFPNGYDCVEKIPFVAEIKCNTFTQLAKQISYLMMVDISETESNLEEYLKTQLSQPEFQFNQVIEVFQKHKR